MGRMHPKSKCQHATDIHEREKDGSVDRVQHQSNERSFHRFGDLPIKNPVKGHLAVSISGTFTPDLRLMFEPHVRDAAYLKIK